MNPFLIPQPFIVNFSGGRTSGRMLAGILDAFGGSIPAGSCVCFENTGKEREETLEFNHEIETRWGVPIVWLEYRRDGDQHSFHVVDYETAARHGEPFEALLGKMAAYRASKDKPPVLPNPVQRFCTAELKIRTVKRFLKSRGQNVRAWNVAIGFRADEPHRVARMRSRTDAGDIENGEPHFPLHAAGITQTDVLAWWKAQPFDLKLEPHEGNCDLCFLKKTIKLSDIMRRRPDSAEWWARMEQETGQRFRKDRAGYAGLLKMAQEKGEPLFGWDDEPEGDACFCTD